MRDGMGVERLRQLAHVEVGIVTGESSAIVEARAAKLQIRHLYRGIRDKAALLSDILEAENLQAEEVAFIGDDMNDAAILKLVGLSACPADALPEISAVVHYRCSNPGGHGAFREFAEFIIQKKKDWKGEGLNQAITTNYNYDPT